MHEAEDGSSTSARNSFVDHLLEECHATYLETGNRFFVWRAIDLCSPKYWGRRIDIPEWCFAPLFDAACQITEPTFRILQAENTPDAQKPTQKDWERMREELPAALGLASPGKNQFRNALSVMRKIRIAKAYHLDRAVKGSSAKEALDEAKQVTGRVPSGNTAPGDRDPNEDRMIFATVAKGVRLSTGGKAPPRRRSGRARVIKPGA